MAGFLYVYESHWTRIWCARGSRLAIAKIGDKGTSLKKFIANRRLRSSYNALNVFQIS